MHDVTTRSNALARAHRCYADGAWGEAFAQLAALDEDEPLTADDLERLVWSAALIGLDDRFVEVSERLYHARLAASEPQRAARAAFWLGFRLMLQGEHGRGAGWLGRCQRIVDDTEGECAEQGYLLLLPINRCLAGGDFAEAARLAVEAAAIGERFAEPDLMALACNFEGRALLRAGQLAEGMARLDNCMVAVTAGELSPIVTGLVYCSVISSCNRVYALERAREWTAALACWCDAQPELVTFRGACQVHRSEILQLGGEWQVALEHAERAALDDPLGGDREAAADACYQVGELHRLRGEHAAAEASYVRASALGREPQPGLARLRAAEGRHKTALAGIRRVLLETSDALARAGLLPAHIEIALAASEVAEARKLSEELDAIAERFASEVLSAIAAHARGLVHLADNDPSAALGPLRRAFFVWQRIGAPYEEARSRVALATACRALGDMEGARLALDSARATFEALGAAPDLAALAAHPLAGGGDNPLSARELQVLRLVATGKTNRTIAQELTLSEKTVDRHVSNILAKLEVTSRAGATAYAYEHDLI